MSYLRTIKIKYFKTLTQVIFFSDFIFW